MAKLTLKERILAYYQKHPGEWIASGEIQRMVTEKTKYTAQNAGRRMRELAEDNLLEVEYRKGHAFYRAVPVGGGPVTKRQVIVVDGIAKEIYTTIMQ